MLHTDVLHLLPLINNNFLQLIMCYSTDCLCFIPIISKGRLIYQLKVMFVYPYSTALETLIFYSCWKQFTNILAHLLGICYFTYTLDSIYRHMYEFLAIWEMSTSGLLFRFIYLWCEMNTYRREKQLCGLFASWGIIDYWNIIGFQR